jgi:hypothetical protein
MPTKPTPIENIYKRTITRKEEMAADKTNLIALRLNDEQMREVNRWAKQHRSNISEVIRVAIEMMTGARKDAE